MAVVLVAYVVVGLPTSYVLAFSFGMGYSGLWLGVVFGLAVAAVLLISRYRRVLRRSQIGNFINP